MKKDSIKLNVLYRAAHFTNLEECRMILKTFVLSLSNFETGMDAAYSIVP